MSHLHGWLAVWSNLGVWYFRNLGGILLMLGLFTRPTAFILSGQMAVAYFMAHASKSILFPIVNGGESAVLFCFIFLYIATSGGGKWALDNLLTSQKELKP
ncbi:MAG: DoxX family protein [Moraxella sp.]